MNKTIFNVFVYGAAAAVATSLIKSLMIDTCCIIVYLAMILGALMSIASILGDSD